MLPRITGALGRAAHGLGPATGAGSPREALRAGLGSCLGLGVLGVVMLSSGVDLHLGMYLIAPFGATTVLVFAAPNSPLAQPWAVVVGSVVSAVVGVGITLVVDEPTVRVALAVGAAVAAMILCRAVHPPAGAVAMSAALAPDTVRELGFRFALAPVAVGAVLLVVTAVAFGRLTGRQYPFRQFDPVADPAERVGLREDELADILARYQQSLNLGVADLARLVGAAELQAAGHVTGPVEVASVMSRDLVTVAPRTGREELARLFGEHGFTSLPVVGADGAFAGVVFQIDLIESGLTPTAPDVFAAPEMYAAPEVCATDIMTTDLPVAHRDTPIAALLPQLAERGCDAVPVLDGPAIVGIVTQTDLITVLARHALRNGGRAITG